MSEFRQNYATKEWVIVAPERARRPMTIAADATSSELVEQWKADCPFCSGNEALTGSELYRTGTEHAWSMRTVRNKFSALTMDAPVSRERMGRFLKAGSHGHAEVIIESPRHNDTLANFDQARMEELLNVYLWRMTDVSIYPDIAIAMLFRNHGGSAGRSIAHPHSQLVASPIIPPHLRDPIQKAMLHYDTWGNCVFCDILTEELAQRKRIIAENEHAVAFCPFASRTPYEVRIYPRKHNAAFTWISSAELKGVASILLKTLQALRNLLGDPAYNLVLRSAPTGDEDVRYLHWYLLVVPRITTPAGFEIGSGIYINPIPPEVCGQELRNAIRSIPE